MNRMLHRVQEMRAYARDCQDRARTAGCPIMAEQLIGVAEALHQHAALLERQALSALQS